MGNPLTWRDVAAPDFSTSLRAIGTAGAALSNGFNGLGEGLGLFNEYNQGQNAAALMANAVKYTNPADLQAAFANGSIMNGVNPEYLTADALANTQNKVGTLLTNAANTETNKVNLQLDPLRVAHAQDQQTVDAGTQAARILAPTLANDQTVANTGLIRANVGLVGANTALVGSETATSDQNRTQSASTYARGTAAYDADQAALPFITKLQTQVNGPDDVQNIIGSPEFQALSPMAQQRVVAAAQPYITGGSGTGGVGNAPASRAIAGAAGAPGAQPGTAAASPFSAVPGYMALPGDPDVAGMKIGDLQDYQTKTLLPRTGATTVGGLQISRDTITQYAPKVLGPDWKNQPFTPENQSKIGEAIFNANKDGNLKSKWSSLPDATPGAYANKTWAQMQPIIMQGETRNVGPINKELVNLQKENAHYSTASTLATQGINAALSQANADNINAKYGATQQDTRTTGEIVTSMLDPKTSTSAYKILPASRLIKDIEAFKQAHPGTTSATAAAVMEAHPEGAGFIARHLKPWLGGYDAIPNEGAVADEGKAIDTGATYTAGQTNQGAQALSGMIAKAQSDHQTALTNVAAALHNPSITPDQLAGYRNKAAITRTVLEGYLNAQKKDPTLNFQKNADAPGEEKLTSAPQDTGSAGLEPTPATQAITAAAAPTTTTNPDYQDAKARADQAYDALVQATKTNDPQKAKYEAAYEQADRALNALTPSPNAPVKLPSGKQAQPVAAGPNLGLITNRPVGAAFKDLLASIRAKSSQPYVVPKFNPADLIAAASRD